MARIAQEEIDRIKREVRIEELVRAKGIELRAHGENLVGRCIWHQDDTPSLVITPAKNLWHCMGACQTGGDVFAWIQRAEGVRSFRHAYEILYAMAPAAHDPTSPASVELVSRSTVPKLGSPLRVEMSDDELLVAYVEYCHEELLRKPEARAYLGKRGIDSQEAIDAWRIGYANRTIGLRLPFSNRREGEELRSRLTKLGIYRASGHEHFAGSIIVPIFGAEGRVTEIYGRKLRDDLRAGTAYHTYLPGPHRGVWNLGALRESKEIVLCEAAIDALTLWVNGIRNVTWSYGVEGFTRDHFEAMKAYGTERVVIAYDRDEAGDRAALKLADRLMSEGIDCYRVELPRGMDINDYARRMTPSDKALAIAIRTAALIGKGRAEGRGQKSEVAEWVDSPLPPIGAADEAIDKPAPSLAASSPAGEPVNVLTFPSSPAPAPPPAAEMPLEMRGEEIVITLGDRVYRVRGMKKNTSYDSLRINMLLTRETAGAVYLDTFDLSSARQRAMFEKQAAVEIGLQEEALHRDMGQILRALEELRAKQIEEATKPKTQTITMTDEERAAALELLRDPNLIPRIARDLGRCGLVGEETNKLMTYLACTSRKLERPLAVIIQSSSAAGKTTLMDAVLGCMPAEEVVRYSAITGKALFYIPEPTSLKHKILAISEEEGAEQATYALKLLQSEGQLSIASTGKDPTTGRLESQEYHVEGPIMPVMTTTAAEVDEELQNRCIVLTTDEERAQTRAIHERQRASLTIEGLISTREADHVRALHQNAQRLIRPLLVAIPNAEELTFLDSRTRTRRDHMKYLTLIRTIALLHQYQRPRKTRELASGASVDYIEATLDDIALANELAHEVLGRSLDELAPQTRKLLVHLREMTGAACKRMRIEQSEYRFMQRDVREHLGWPDHQVKLHLRKLVDMEYVLVHHGGRGQSFVYELLYRGEGDAGKPFLVGLVDVEKLRGTTKERDSRKGEWDSEKGDREMSGTARGHIGERPGTSAVTSEKASADAALSEVDQEQGEKLLLPKPEKKPKIRSYPLRRGDGNGRAGSHEFRPSTLLRRRRRDTSAPRE